MSSKILSQRVIKVDVADRIVTETIIKPFREYVRTMKAIQLGNAVLSLAASAPDVPPAVSIISSVLGDPAGLQDAANGFMLTTAKGMNKLARRLLDRALQQDNARETFVLKSRKRVPRSSRKGEN